MINWSCCCFCCFCRIYSDGERLTIELGRALRSGEYKCKVYYMKLADVSDTAENLTFLCDWILCNGASVGKTKREILAQIASNDTPYDIPIERCRLRKKNANSPGKIFLDEQVFGDDVFLLSNYEVSQQKLHNTLRLNTINPSHSHSMPFCVQIILQELDDASQQVTDEKSLTMFVRRWSPSQMTLGPFSEITIYGETWQRLTQKKLNVLRLYLLTNCHFNLNR